VAQVRRVGRNRLVDFSGKRLEIVRPARFKPAKQSLLQWGTAWIYLRNKTLNYGTVTQELECIPDQISWHVPNDYAIRGA
jgi:hypothetical protein